MNDCAPITQCIACGNEELTPVLDLGFQPLANDYVKEKNTVQQQFPLSINRCNHCFHVQLTHQVNPELMFKDYAYVSGVSKTTLSFFSDITEMGIQQFGKFPMNVLDIGCNDGTLLDIWEEGSPRDLKTFGVDPATNLFEVSSKKGHNIHCGFFNGKEFGDQKFDIITCLNAFAHNPNPLQMLLDIKEVMHEGSVLICSTSQSDMIKNGEFDTIYHEHVSFFNIRSMRRLCERSGLQLSMVKKHPIHGNSYIFIITHLVDNDVVIPMEILLDRLEKEESYLYELETYDRFSERANHLMEHFSSIIRAYRRSGVPVIGYSAPAKGNTLMNACEEGPDFIFEDTPQKQGTFSPGLHIPIMKPDYSLLENHDTVVWIPLAWNFYKEITDKIKASRSRKKDIFLKTFPNMWLENDEGGGKH